MLSLRLGAARHCARLAVLQAARTPLRTPLRVSAVRLGYYPMRHYSNEPKQAAQAESAPSATGASTGAAGAAKPAGSAEHASTKANTETGAAVSAAKAEKDASKDPNEVAKDAAKDDATKDAPKPTLWQKVKKEAKHYWDGTKLLGYEIKVSFKLSLKMASGQKLSRREHRQLKRTTQDIVRLVPFSMFVLVPFAELLLPVALKLFPNMLPSTYESAKSKEAKGQKLSNERKRVSEFLRGTVQGSKFLPKPHTDEQRKAFAELMTLVQRGESVPQKVVLEVCHLFRDDVLLDNMTRPQLASLARYMNLQPFGTSTVVRYLIRHRLMQIKRDDYVIDKEGVESLNSAELVSACRARGFSTVGVSVGRLKSELAAWLQLRLHERVPSSLLLLANTLNYGTHDVNSYYDALSAAIGSLPDEVYHEAELEVKDDSATNEERLEVLKEQDELISNENKEEEESGSVVKVDDTVDCDEPECHEPEHNHTNPKHPDNEAKPESEDKK